MRIDKTNVKTPLTNTELETLMSKQMPNDQLERVRDVFAFCCFTFLALIGISLIFNQFRIAV